MTAKKKILLLSMPFGALERPALGLSLFKARLADEGIPCEVRYLTFIFAHLIGVEDYRWISTDLPHTAFAGEWVFTPALYGPNACAHATYVRDILQGIWRLDDRCIARILRAQTMAEHFLDYCLDTVPWGEYALLGFTSTFEQNLASLALAKRVKEAYPQVHVVFGGANWEDEMGLELHRRFPFVDFACRGEADESFPTLVRLLLAGHLKGKRRDAIPGLIYRANGRSVPTEPARPVEDLDSLPIPDYSDYFRDFDLSSAGSCVVPTLLFEGARGCWWGAKRHCTFCGLNGRTLAYRAKSAERALREVEHLAGRWRIDMLQAVDNVVNMSYFRDFFPALARAKRSLRFFYEIRANLSHEQVKMLRDAGVLNVQPGIESLNDHVLQLMRKGTTALQNVQLLRWCSEYGVQADWNLLYGFPGETAEDYDQLLCLLRQIRFLNAPTACGPIRLDRFSPYFNEAATYGLVNVRPMPPYKYLYPFGEECLRKIAYYFDYDYAAPHVPATGRSAALIQYVSDWKANPEPGSLQAFERPDGTLAILDTRSSAIRTSATLRGIDKQVYDYCDRARSLAAIRGHIRRTFPHAKLSESQVGAFLAALVAHGYMITDGARFLSLAIRVESIEDKS